MPGPSGDGIRPRPGPAPRLIEGPKPGQRSLYHQQVLEEDAYTHALSHIIQRDFFPNLPHLHATNDYLSALADNDPELLSSSIRRLTRLAAAKDDVREARRTARLDPEARRRAEVADTPRSARFGETPGGETPGFTTVRRSYHDGDSDEDDDDAPGPSDRASKRARLVRDDLSLDAFQRNYTSEDNASFVHIVEDENRRRREDKAWAFEAERVAEDKRIAMEEKRKLILDAATSGAWRVDANGRRLIGGLAEGGPDRHEGEAWKQRKMIAAKVEPAAEGTTLTIGNSTKALVKSQGGGTLVKATDASSVSTLPPSTVEEKSLPEEHPLSRALVSAGLPPTALVSTEDGAIVPQREAVAGSGEGRGRGAEERNLRQQIEKDVMGSEERDGGGRVQQWPYKAMNGLMFPPDANVKPFPDLAKPKAKRMAVPPSISHRNTRLQEEEEEEEPSGFRAGSIRGSSPARSNIDAVIDGRPYIPRDQRAPSEPHHLVPTEADPVPEDLPPLMTWGTLLTTPRRLDGGASDDPLDLDSPSFRLPETKRRDEIGRKLGAKASRSIADRARSYAPRPAPSTPSLGDALRAAANRTQTPASRSVRGAGAMNPPNSTPRREEGLTNAARSLLDRSLGRTPQRGGGLASALGSSSGKARAATQERVAGWGRSSAAARSWTPSPAPRR